MSEAATPAQAAYEARMAGQRHYPWDDLPDDAKAKWARIAEAAIAAAADHGGPYEVLRITRSAIDGVEVWQGDRTTKSLSLGEVIEHVLGLLGYSEAGRNPKVFTMGIIYLTPETG